MKQVSDKLLLRFTMAFMYIPVAIWLFTWCGLWIAVPATAAVIYGLYRFTKDMTGRTDYSLPVLILFCIALSAVLIKGGHLAIFSQHSDWFKSNAIMTDMAERSWPVVYENGKEEAMLTYYTGIYILPALAGKAFGIGACRYVLFIETILTALLIYLNLCRCLRVKSAAQSALIALCLLIFNLPTVLFEAVQMLLGRFGVREAYTTVVNSTYLVTWDIPVYEQNWEPLPQGYMYTANMIGEAGFRGMYVAQTSFLPHYMITLITTVWFGNRDKPGSYMFIWVPAALYCSMSLPYAFILVTAGFIGRLMESKKRFRIIADNIICAVPAMPLAVYYTGYMLGEKEGGYYALSLNGTLPMTLLMFMTCALPLFAFSYRKNCEDTLFWLTGLLMLLSCIPSYGRFNDLMITGTIPLVALLLIYTAKTLVRGLDGGLAGYRGRRSSTLCKAALLLFMAMGTVNATRIYKVNGLKELAESFQEDLRDAETTYTYTDLTERYGIDVKDSNYKDCDYKFIVDRNGYTYGTMAIFADRDAKCEHDLKYNYFTYDYRGSPFWNIFARK